MSDPRNESDWANGNYGLSHTNNIPVEDHSIDSSEKWNQISDSNTYVNYNTGGIIQSADQHSPLQQSNNNSSSSSSPHHNSGGGGGGGGGGVSAPATAKEESASDKRARIAREQWDDYIERFQPYEDKLKNIYEGGGLLDGEVEAIKPTVDGAFAASKGMADRNMSRYGVKLTEAEQANRNRSQAISQATATAGGYNRLWQTAQSRRDQIMTGTDGRSSLGE